MHEFRSPQRPAVEAQAETRSSSFPRPSRGTPRRRRRDPAAEINTANECMLFLVAATFGANRPCRHTGGPCSKIGDILTFLRRRFVQEERMMQEGEYPAAAEHRSEHTAILARLEVMHQTLECGRYDPEAVLAFLESWAVEHIENHDKPLGHYMVAAEAQTPAPRVEPVYDHPTPH